METEPDVLMEQVSLMHIARKTIFRMSIFVSPRIHFNKIKTDSDLAVSQQIRANIAFSGDIAQEYRN